MPRVTKSLTAKTKHKKILKATKGHYGAVGYIKQLNNLILNLCNMPSGIEKIKKELLGPYGYRE